MIQLGKFQDLYIVKRKDFGVYVNDKKDTADGSILLPAKQVPKVARIGDLISCFVNPDQGIVDSWLEPKPPHREGREYLAITENHGNATRQCVT